MALGGGTWLVQNKILPGSYINFVSAARASATLSERGTATIPVELDWGPDGEIFAVTNGEFQKDSLKIFGHAYTEEALKPLRERKPRPPRPAREEGEKRDFEPMVPAETFAPTEPPVIHPEDTPAGRAQKFLMDVTDRMGVKVDVYVDDSKADNLSIHMIGDTLGILIGRRGETLDAIQHLTNYAINRGQNKRVRINVDAESYRLKREQALQRLAQKVAGKVTRYRRNITLEPMNAYERHVIHAALQDHPDVTTFSTGTEPNRRIVVAYSRYKSAEAAVKEDFPETEEE